MAGVRMDWGVMRGAMILFFVSLVLGGGLMFAAEWFHDRAVARFDQQHKLLNSVRSSYQQVDEEELIMQEYLPVYREYTAQGIIGEERRLTWVEALREVANRLGMPSMRYEIGTQVEHDPEVPLQTGRHRLLRTEMTLEMDLFHEGDLVRVLQAVEAGADGLYSVDACELTRSRLLFGTDPRQANMSAACTLRWFSLQPPDA